MSILNHRLEAPGLTWIRMAPVGPGSHWGSSLYLQLENSALLVVRMQIQILK